MAATHTDSSSPPPPLQFKIGETVNIARRGNAVVVAGPITEPGHKFHGRIQVRYADGSLYHAQPSALRRFEQPPARVLVVETTDHYRAAAQAFIHPHDVVLEVGCSHGITCELIHQRGAQVVGVDKCPELVAESRARYPHLRFEAVDAFDLPALRALSPRPDGSFTKICIDIGGVAELHTVMGLVGLYFRGFHKAQGQQQQQQDGQQQQQQGQQQQGIGGHQRQRPPPPPCLIVKSKYLKTLLGAAQVWVPPRELQQQQEKLQRRQQQQREQQKQQREQQMSNAPSPQLRQAGAGGGCNGSDCAG